MKIETEWVPSGTMSGAWAGVHSALSCNVTSKALKKMNERDLVKIRDQLYHWYAQVIIELDGVASVVGKNEIGVELSDSEALALAQLVKRISMPDLKQFSSGDAEASSMSSAIERVRVALARIGYEPR